ncbi:LamG-like jellyroll fold domain-containing protein [Actinosynnema sp. NPDC047251]|uniref:LamG-like jellyroll fold domain-containing protein n=1 Tax=Saccharothrix espanaensis TaxID=103731 RepID=UPI0002EC7CAA|nr:LamG-like jellyroll fold domain-containing protein [Saccharothrix espanaensis]
MVAALTACALAAQTLVGMAPAAIAEPEPTASADQPSPADVRTTQEKSALGEAQRTGVSVPVEDKLTETSTVLANPDGTLTLRSHAKPVRANKDGAWHDVDTNLSTAADGTLTPAAIPIDVAFSGGGTTPLVTMREDGKEFSLSWPTPLPAPTVDGSSAIYPEVLPGVDLQLTANSTGYSEVLVVKNEQAAANPALSSFTLHAATDGLNLISADDVLSATDDSGKVVFQGSTPIMWDSTRDEKRGPAPTATDPGGGKVSTLDIVATTVDNGASTTAELTISPDDEALRGEDVQYPVYIDPLMSRYHDGWAEVTSSGWHYWNANMDAQVGLCGNWTNCDGSWVARSFFRFTTNELRERNGREPKVFSAAVYAMQKHGTSCNTDYPVSLYQTDAFDWNTRWPGPNGGPIDTQWSRAGEDCGGAGKLEFNAWSPVSGIIEHNWDYLHVGLRSPDEGNRNQWKKFANNPYLDVLYAFPPNPATGLWVGDGVNCGGKVVTASAKPTLYATATDNNPDPLPLGLYYEVWTSDGLTLKANTGSSPPTVISSGSQGAWITNNALPNGDYAYRVSVQNKFPSDPNKDLWAGFYSNWSYFTARPDPITAAPTISSADYPAGYWGRPQNLPGTFTFDANGAANIVGFTYTFTGAGTEVVPAANDCDYNRTFGTTGGWAANNGGKATITLPAGMSPGYHTVHVRSFDDAHKLSPRSQAYTFYVAPSYVTPVPVQRIEAENITPTGTVPGTVTTDPVASGGKYVTATASTSGSTDRIRFPFTVPTTGDYNLDAGLIDSAALPDNAEFELDGRQVGNMFTSAGTQPTRVDLQLAGVRLAAGPHELAVKITKKAGSTATTFKVGLDYIDLSPTVKLDFEALAVTAQDKPLSHWGNPVWNSSAMKRFEADNTGQSISFTVTTPIEADYAVGLGMVKNNNRGKFTVSIDDTVIGKTDTTPVDGYDPNMINTYVGLGGTHLTPGNHTITFKVIDANPASAAPKYLIGLDYLTIQPINNVTASSFTDAMNNDGIADDGVNGNFGAAGSSLSAQTLAAAGLAPGNTVMIGGAAFTMPTANTTTGNDHVVAVGQTIPFPAAQQVKAAAVGLLALSTCGTTPERHGTITYTDGTATNPLFPELGDWVKPIPDNPTGITLSYRNYQLVKEPQYQPVITPIFLPADPTRTIKSITLPIYGSTLLDRDCDTELHVLAMAPRPVDTGWIGTWVAPVDAAVVPPGGHGFGNKTLRTVLHPTVTGGQARVKLSNALNPAPVTIGAATLAAQTGTDSATTTPTTLTFSGGSSVTIPAGGEAYSDPVTSPSGGNGNLVVSLHLPNATTLAPVHANATAPTYLAAGNTVTNTNGTPFTTTLNGSYFVTGVDVSTPDTSQGTIVVLGDHLTATAPPGTTQRNTWVDHLPGKLAGVGATLPGGLVNASRAGIPDTARWRLDDGTGTTARDAVGTNTATTHGGTTWSTDHNGSVALNGTNAYLQTAGKVLDTSTSFSVTAWAKIASLDTYQTIVSQDGVTGSTFFLQYNTQQRRWALSIHGQDTLQHDYWRAYSTNEPVPNTWTHLAATYDATTRTARLYVNGNLEGTATNVTTFPTNGPFTIGRARYANNHTDYFNGSIADVRAHQRTLSTADIRQTQQNNSLPDLGASSAGNSAIDTYRSAFSAPNVRTILVAAGATDILNGASAPEVSANLTRLISTERANGLKRHNRTDGSRVHVILTTIPPLGLAANDPRETHRRNLNQALLANSTDYDADHVVDYDAAVRDTTNPNQLAPQYLTNGTPNDTYHNQLAQYLADAVNDFPPRAEL